MEVVPVIKTDRLTKKYGKFLAVDNVSLTINCGEIYGLIGKNGAGKTTLLKLIMGVANATNGSVSILGSQDSAGLRHARGNVGFMLEPGFFSYMTARQNLEYFRKLKGIGDAKEIESILEMVELDQVKKAFKTYSMGMKQRLSIANALMGRPDVIIMDEPINGLDPEGIAEFRKMILKLNQEYKITFLISSHILAELSMMATRFGFIDKGVLLKELSQEELHMMNQKSLNIKVDDVNRACVILEQELNTTNYKVNEKEEIILFDYVLEPEEVVSMLVHKNIKISKVVPTETSLEEYFLNLVGGHDA